MIHVSSLTCLILRSRRAHRQHLKKSLESLRSKGDYSPVVIQLPLISDHFKGHSIRNALTRNEPLNKQNATANDSRTRISSPASPKISRDHQQRRHPKLSRSHPSTTRTLIQPLPNFPAHLWYKHLDPFMKKLCESYMLADLAKASEQCRKRAPLYEYTFVYFQLFPMTWHTSTHA